MTALDLGGGAGFAILFFFGARMVNTGLDASASTVNETNTSVTAISPADVEGFICR